MKTILAIWMPITFSLIFVALSLYFSIIFILPAIFGAGDARARYIDFRKMLGNKCEKKLHKMRRSACQRYAAIAAFEDKNKAIRYFKKLGYRWYHVLPDGTFSIKNNCYLKKKFYLNLLGLGK